MAATSVAKLMQIEKTIRESLSSFQGVEHRLEKVLKIQMYILMIQKQLT
jgi:UDP-N-acetylmuramoylalanine--D-glutamate ligase